MIEIKCSGADYLSLDELSNFQGELKYITPENLDKLKLSIKKHGFIAPFLYLSSYFVKKHPELLET